MIQAYLILMPLHFPDEHFAMQTKYLRIAKSSSEMILGREEDDSDIVSCTGMICAQNFALSSCTS